MGSQNRGGGNVPDVSRAEEMAAYDQLGPLAKAAIDACVVEFSPHYLVVGAKKRGMDLIEKDEALAQLVRDADAKEAKRTLPIVNAPLKREQR